MKTDIVLCTSQKVLSIDFRSCRIGLFNRYAEPPRELEWMWLCGERAWNTGKFMGTYQVKLQIAQSWMMSWLRKAEWWSNSTNSFALLGGGGEGISVTNSCKYWHFSFLQKRTISSLSRSAGNCQQKVEASPETWSARLPLDLQTKAIWKEELNVWMTCCSVEPALRLGSEAWKHSVLCVSQH